MIKKLNNLRANISLFFSPNLHLIEYKTHDTRARTRSIQIGRPDFRKPFRMGKSKHEGSQKARTYPHTRIKPRHLDPSLPCFAPIPLPFSRAPVPSRDTIHPFVFPIYGQPNLANPNKRVLLSIINKIRD